MAKKKTVPVKKAAVKAKTSAKKPLQKVKPKAPAKKVVPTKSLPAAKKVAPAKAAPKKLMAKAPPPATKQGPVKPVTKAVVKEALPIKAPAEKTRVPKEKGPVIAVMTGLEPLGGPTKTLSRAKKERFTMEFYLRATPGSLYDLLSSPSGFSEWFCDDVDVHGENFTFRWGMDSQTAQCLGRKFGEMIRFHWEHDDDAGSFFELRIRIDPMTNETCLVVTDHAWPKDMDEAKALWESQIHTLQRVLGA